MFYAPYSTLFGILVFCSQTETADFSLKPSNPSYAVEGEDFILEWTFTLDGSLISVKFSNVTGGGDDPIGSRLGPGEVNSTEKYGARFRAQATNIRAELKILAVQLSDEGTYQLTMVSSSATFTSESATVIVHSPPSNIITSSDQTITAPAELSLNCTADGKPTPTTTWTRVSDNTVVYMPLNISGGKNKESYKCTADNVVRKPLTKVVNITILYKPDTVSLIANTTENTNCSDLLWVNLTCETSDANPPVERYQLLKSGEIWAPSDNGIWIIEISEAGKLIYSCRALHFLGNVTSSDKAVTFNVLGQISVFASGSEVLIEGGNVFLHCDASAYPKPTVAWSKLNADDVALLLSSWLNFTNIRRDEAGDYVCIANNTCGTRKSSRRTIDVQFAPENASLSTNVSKVPVVCVGMVVRFTCTVVATNPAVDTFTFYENGIVISNKTDSGVWIKTLDTGGKVTYKCQANNSEGSSSSSETPFSVKVSASATIESNSVVVKEGQDVDLVCNGSGLPSPNISWVNVSNVVLENGRILSLHNVSRTMAGQYICKARNSCGNDSEKVDILVQCESHLT